MKLLLVPARIHFVLVPVISKRDLIQMLLASGHLYERLQKIMIVSLLSHTKSKVKFWFLENFASPHYKDFMPIMAKEYGFDYEFVTYNWPVTFAPQIPAPRHVSGILVTSQDKFALPSARKEWIPRDSTNWN